jgi:hypothetical protein
VHEEISFILPLVDLLFYRMKELEEVDEEDEDKCKTVMVTITTKLFEYKGHYQTWKTLRNVDNEYVWLQRRLLKIHLLASYLSDLSTLCTTVFNDTNVNTWPVSLRERIQDRFADVFQTLKMFPVASMSELLDYWANSKACPEETAFLQESLEVTFYWMGIHLETFMFEFEAMNSLDERFFHRFAFQENDPVLNQLLVLFERLDWIYQQASTVVTLMHPLLLQSDKSLLVSTSQQHSTEIKVAFECFPEEKIKVETTLKEVALSWYEIFNQTRAEWILLKSQTKTGDEYKKGFEFDNYAAWMNM